MASEYRLRARCRMFLTSHLMPPCWFSSIEHGRKHSGDDVARAKEWGQMKSQGVKSGIGDMIILAPSYTFFAELKVGKNDQEESQRRFQAAMAALGHGYEVIRSVEQFGEKLIQHGIPLAAGWRIAAMHHDAALDGEANIRTSKPKVRTSGTKVRTTKPTRGQISRGNELSLAMAGKR